MKPSEIARIRAMADLIRRMTETVVIDDESCDLGRLIASIRADCAKIADETESLLKAEMPTCAQCQSEKVTAYCADSDLWFCAEHEAELNAVAEKFKRGLSLAKIPIDSQT